VDVVHDMNGQPTGLLLRSGDDEAGKVIREFIRRLREEHPQGTVLDMRWVATNLEGTAYMLLGEPYE
jgi:hypothetical protein